MAFTHILIPTDFSETAQHVLGTALEEATVHHATVTLLHVLSSHASTDVYFITGAPHAPAGFDPALERRLGASTPASRVVRNDPSEAAMTQLHDLMPASFQGSWDVAVEVGHPAETIVRVAQERGVDLIVMGTHGRTGLSHALMGSVAEKVVRLAPCPVLTIRAGVQEQSEHV